jgi:hypothetical protein
VNGNDAMILEAAALQVKPGQRSGTRALDRS